MKSAYGEAIEEEVDNFYNLRSSEDNVLEMYPFSPFDFVYKTYPLFEGDQALGQAGYQKLLLITLPSKYGEEDVKNQIKDIHDSDEIEGYDFSLCNNQLGIIIFVR